ncbi:MAG: biopolymer transporter ExbD, partial [Spirochaetales bacterium]|nr:biopolymer transporter ExbD [Spirochaetales bacterium]
MDFTKNIKNSEFNLDLTPIVDVVFNLLIFFALSLNFSEITSSLNIKLPKAQSSEVITDKQIVVG